MGRANLDAMHSSQNQDWNSPRPVRALVHAVRGWSSVREYLPGEVDELSGKLIQIPQTMGLFTDPCHNDGSIMDAATTYNETQNGLKHPWGRRAYVNSPYGDALPGWVKECAERWRHYGTEIIALWPSRTDTEWFQQYIAPTASAILFWAGRLQFMGADYPAPFPSMVICWAYDPLPFARNAQRYGSVLIPRGPRAGLYPQRIT